MEERLVEPGPDEGRRGGRLAREVRVDLSSDEGAEPGVEDLLDRVAALAGEPEVGEVEARGEAVQGIGEPPPDRFDLLVAEVARQSLGDDRRPGGGVEPRDQLAEAPRPAVAENVEVGDPVAVRQRVHPGEGIALTGGHRRQIRLDVDEIVAVAGREPPAAR